MPATKDKPFTPPFNSPFSTMGLPCSSPFPPTQHHTGSPFHSCTYYHSSLISRYLSTPAGTSLPPNAPPIPMGSFFSKLFGRLWGSKEVRILILGLDAAGKSTILYRLQIGTVVQTVPTIGFNVESLTYRNLKFQVWDLGGQTSIRPYWRLYYSGTDAIVYVVDAADPERMGISQEELFSMLEEEELRGVPLLLLANKQDVPGALSAAKVGEALGVSNIKDRAWALYECSAIRGDGIHDGFDWLTNVIRGPNSQL